MAEPLVSWSDYQRFRSRFADELDPALYTVEWLDLQLWSGQFQLFTDAESAILTSIRTYPTGARELHGEMAVGKVKTITGSLIPQAIEWARSIGCAFAVIQSRPGWERVMRRDGFELHQVSIRKAL